ENTRWQHLRLSSVTISSAREVRRVTLAPAAVFVEQHRAAGWSDPFRRPVLIGTLGVSRNGLLAIISVRAYGMAYPWQVWDLDAGPWTPIGPAPQANFVPNGNVTGRVSSLALLPDRWFPRVRTMPSLAKASPRSVVSLT